VRELSLASLELLRDEELAKIVAAERMTIITPFGRKYQLVSTNQLFFQKNLSYKVKGIKTGTTSLAGEALASLLERDGVEILIVVLSAQNRYNDTVSLADFVFDNYVWQEKTSLP
jgi:D-alanyl-D-alanine carboxypeptidase